MTHRAHGRIFGSPRSVGSSSPINDQRRRTFMRLLATAGLAALLAAGCTSAAPSPSATTAAASALATTSAAASATAPAAGGSAPTPSSGATSPLVGVWKTGSVTKDQMVAALQRAGLQKWIQPFLATGIGDDNVFTLRIKDGHWVQYWSSGGGSSEENDTGGYSIDGTKVTVSHGSNGSDSFEWSVSGDQLTLTVGVDTVPPSNGIPENVYQTAFYAAAPYVRQP
jgi:hypothetical protein